MIILNKIHDSEFKLILNKIYDSEFKIKDLVNSETFFQKFYNLSMCHPSLEESHTDPTRIHLMTWWWKGWHRVFMENIWIWDLRAKTFGGLCAFYLLAQLNELVFNAPWQVQQAKLKSGVFRTYCNISFIFRSHSSSYALSITSFHRKQHKRIHYIKFKINIIHVLISEAIKLWKKLVTQIERNKAFEIWSASYAISLIKSYVCQVFIISTLT